MPDQRKRAGVFETLGAWLHLWTPPRDVHVPPVPWRKLLLFGVPVLLVLLAAGWYVLDQGAETRRSNEAADARRAAERTAERRAALRKEQAPRRADSSAATRPGLVAGLEDAIFGDAKQRLEDGVLRRRVRRVECEPHPRTDPRRAVENDPARKSGRYYCLGVTRKVVGVGEGGLLGYPFLARIVYGSGTFVWCKIAPVPGEQIIADPRTILAVPKACR